MICQGFRTSVGSTELLVYGAPQHVRSDNGSEFITTATWAWLERSVVGPLYIKPGSPWENGHAEIFHSKLRDEFLGCEVYESVRDAVALGTAWRRQGNEVRPHSLLGYITPASWTVLWAFAAR